MKLNRINFRTLVMQIILLAGFSLLQGCATGRGPVSWMNWPFGQAQYDQYDSAEVPAGPLTDESMNIEPVLDLPMDFTDVSSAPYTPPITSVPYTPPADAQIYKVQKGDTLSSIAARYGTSWKNLQSFNNMSNPNKIIPGQELRIPAELGAPAPVVRSAVRKSSSSHSSSSKVSQGSTYVIQRGDSLAKIAKRSGLTVADLKTANGLTSDRIIAGKKLTIPRKGHVAAKSSAKTTAVKSTTTKTSTIPAPAPMIDSELAPVVNDVVVPKQIDKNSEISVPSDVKPVTVEASPVYDHVLYPGETLEDVARQYGCSKQDIMLLNSITDASSVKPGTKLLVPMPK